MVVIVNSVYINLPDVDMDSYGDSNLYKFMTFYQSFGMCMLSLSFLLFGFTAQRKIWRSYSPSDVQNSWQNDRKFWKGLVRLNIIILVCVVCFVDKAILLIELVRSPGNSSNQTDTNPLHLNVIIWNLIYEWIPDILPRFSLLYLMSRNVEDVGEAGGDRFGSSRASSRGIRGLSSEVNGDEDFDETNSRFKVDLLRN